MSLLLLRVTVCYPVPFKFILNCMKYYPLLVILLIIIELYIAANRINLLQAFATDITYVFQVHNLIVTKKNIINIEGFVG